MVLQKSSMLKRTENSIFILQKRFNRISAWIQKWLRTTNTSVLSPLIFNRICLLLSSLYIGDLFYMCKLWVYVLGIHSCGDNDVVMYCWPEIAGKRSSDEVISCLYDYLSKLPPGITTLPLYSDRCGGQNKNINVLRYLFTLVAVGKFKHIRHIFSVREATLSYRMTVISVVSNWLSINMRESTPPSS